VRVRSDSMRANFCVHQAAIAAKLTPSVYKYPQSASPSRLHAANQTLISNTQTRQPVLILFFLFGKGSAAIAAKITQPPALFLGGAKTWTNLLGLL